MDLTQVNPLTIDGPLTGGGGNPLTISANGITAPYIDDDAVEARHLAAASVTAANGALDANSVVDPNIVSVGINKVTYGTSIFAGDVILSRGPSLPVIVLSNIGMFFLVKRTLRQA